MKSSMNSFFRILAKGRATPPPQIYSISLHLGNTIEVDETAADGPGEPIFTQSLLSFGHRATRFEIALRSVIDEIMLVTLDIAHFCDGQFDEPSAHDIEDEFLLLAAQKKGQPLFHFCAEGGIGNRLDEEVERAHFVPLDRILCHVCIKDDGNVFIHLVQRLRCLQSVQNGHFNIEKDQAISRVIRG